MTPVLFLETAILMGLFVTAGGLWALFYCLGKLRADKGLLWLSVAAYAVALALALALVALTPLHAKWKALILASGFAYAFIPPITLHFLERLHATSEAQP